MIFFGEQPLRKAIAEFEEHYHRERNHSSGSVACRERLGGILKYYYRPAA
jgi:hypothetical protein